VDADFRNRELMFSLYGLDRPGEGSLVPADIFQRKLRSVLVALKEADKTVNSAPSHEYVISHLKMGSLEVGVLERPLQVEHVLPVSSIAAFAECCDAISKGDFVAARRFNGLGEAIRRVSKDAGTKFSHMELRVDRTPFLRVDDFFESQAANFIAQKEEIAAPVSRRFTGNSVDAFDGYLREVDFRGQQWRGKLVLAGGAREIDCVFRELPLEDIRRVLNRRVWAEGLAIYKEESGLPLRLEVSRVRLIKENADLTRWRGALSVDPDKGPVWGDGFDEFH
jgi:hypothetical protein